MHCYLFGLLHLEFFLIDFFFFTFNLYIYKSGDFLKFCLCSFHIFLVGNDYCLK